MNNNYYCIIMAGGMGRRFWPCSRKNLPKQFLDFFGLLRIKITSQWSVSNFLNYRKAKCW